MKKGPAMAGPFLFYFAVAQAYFSFSMPSIFMMLPS